MARIQRCLRLLAAVGLSQALVAPTSHIKAPRQQTITHSTPAEVALAAQTQLLSLAAVTTGEGIWSTVSFGFSVGRAI